MKTSRNQLKALMKELLIEILSEGLGNVQRAPSPASDQVSVASAVSEHRLAGGRRKPTFDPRLDTPLVGGRKPTDALKDTILNESRGNPIIADILADTAMTTLPNQLASGDRMGMPSEGSSVSLSALHDKSPGAGQEQFSGDPAEVFSGGVARADGTSHWADLAFMPAKKST